MNELYRTIGISKQAVHQYARRQTKLNDQIVDLIVQVDELRCVHPGCGVEKMYYTLKPSFIGRDQFIELFMRLGYRIKRKKNYKKTTIRGKIYYPNLIKGIKVNKPNHIWQSDITYVKVNQDYYYAVFIIDVYTKKIVGYSVSSHLRASANIKALRLAIKENGSPQIHHSDRGSQYTFKEYINLLKELDCKISMGLKGPDNAYAERINRTIKEEYLQYWRPKNLRQLQSCITKAVKQYNNQRIHNNLNRVSPEKFILNNTNLKESQRVEIIIYDDN